MKLTSLLTSFLLGTLLLSCQKDIDPIPVDSNLTEKVTLNSTYGSAPLQNMDVYLPAGRTTASTKVLVLIHGGSWHTGDKTELTEYVDSFRRRMPDYAVFNINYRLAVTPNNLFPTQENDVKSAIEFIDSKTQEYSISKTFVLAGVSAGGHLALLQGYKHQNPVKPRAIVSFFGPTDLYEMYYNPTSPLISFKLAEVVGKTPVQDSVLYARSSSINFVNSTAPPTLLLHGGADPLVKASQSTALRDKLTAAGVVNSYVFYPGEGHGWYGATLSDSFNKLQAFLQANVN